MELNVHTGREGSGDWGRVAAEPGQRVPGMLLAVNNEPLPGASHSAMYVGPATRPCMWSTSVPLPATHTSLDLIACTHTNTSVLHTWTLACVCVCVQIHPFVRCYYSSTWSRCAQQHTTCHYTTCHRLYVIYYMYKEHSLERTTVRIADLWRSLAAPPPPPHRSRLLTSRRTRQGWMMETQRARARRPCVAAS